MTALVLEELIDTSQIPTPSYANDPFLAWLRRGVYEGLIEINEPGAWVHIVPEGALLASPAIFRAYAASVGEPQAWSKVQKKFFRLKLHEHAADQTSFVTYVLRKAGSVRSQRHGSRLNGVLIPNPKLVFGMHPIPPPNPAIQRESAVSAHRRKAACEMK